MGNRTDPGLSNFHSVLCKISCDVVTIVSSGLERANQKDIYKIFQDIWIEGLSPLIR